MSELAITAVDVNAWVEAARESSEEYCVRRVMRIILFAVADSPFLKSKMVIKGGVLLALGYGTNRHTRDVDFSTGKRVQEEDPDVILEELDRALAVACSVDEAVLCRVQSHQMKPPDADASFPTLRITVGYAFEGERQYIRMVQGLPSAKTVIIDLSFNEQTCIASAIVMDGHEISAYSLYDQVAEKYRALIQQTRERRNRVRRQDAYDIFKIIEQGYLCTADDKAALLSALHQKCAARELTVTQETIEEPEIAQRSKAEYEQLRDEVSGDLPDFDVLFDKVKNYYHSLPWR